MTWNCCNFDKHDKLRPTQCVYLSVSWAFLYMLLTCRWAWSGPSGSRGCLRF